MSDVTSRLSIMRFEPWTDLDTVVGWRLHESGRDDLRLGMIGHATALLRTYPKAARGSIEKGPKRSVARKSKNATISFEGRIASGSPARPPFAAALNQQGARRSDSNANDRA